MENKIASKQIQEQIMKLAHAVAQRETGKNYLSPKGHRTSGVLHRAGSINYTTWRQLPAAERELYMCVGSSVGYFNQQYHFMTADAITAFLTSNAEATK